MIVQSNSLGCQLVRRLFGYASRMRFRAPTGSWATWTILLLSVAVLPGCSLAVDKKIIDEGKTSFVASMGSLCIRCHDKMIPRLLIACLLLPGGSGSLLVTSQGVPFFLRF